MSLVIRLFLAVAVASLVGCSSSKKDGPLLEPEVPSFAPAASTKSYEAPATIDSAYVQAVIDKLMEIQGTVRRDILATKQYSDLDQTRFDAIFDDPALSFQSNMWRESAADSIPGFKQDPGPAKHTVLELVTVKPNCIWFKSLADENVNYVTSDGSKTQRVDVVVKRLEHDESINPTPWKITQFVPEKLNVVDSERACG